MRRYSWRYNNNNNIIPYWYMYSRIAFGNTKEGETLRIRPGSRRHTECGSKDDGLASEPLRDRKTRALQGTGWVRAKPGRAPEEEWRDPPRL